MKLCILIILIVLYCQQVRLSDLKPYIIGGVPITIDKAPYQVALLSGTYPNYISHVCGGSIISEKWILTAAHCFETTFVRVGSHFWETEGQIFNISKFVFHPKCELYANYVDFDYALIELDGSLEFSKTIQPIMLPTQDEVIPAGVECFVTGWGLTENGDYSHQLRGVDVYIVEWSMCQEFYSFDFRVSDVTETMICAGSEIGGKDSCEGDSGGGLVYNDTLVGIVSWGRGCGSSKFPGVYSNVAYVRDWIKEVTGI